MYMAMVEKNQDTRYIRDSGPEAGGYIALIIALLALVIIGIIAYTNNWFGNQTPTNTNPTGTGTNINLTIPGTTTQTNGALQ